MRKHLEKYSNSYRILLLVFLFAIGTVLWYRNLLGLVTSRKIALGKGTPQQSVSDAASAALAFCVHPQGMTQETCYAKQMEQVAFNHGPEFAFSVLSVMQTQDPGTQGCHFIAHGIGYGTYKRDPALWQQDVNTLNPSCGYGAIHGVIEQYVNTLPGKHLTKEIIPTICSNHPRADCNHIVGHLVLVETNANIDDALRLCEVFVDAQQRQFCNTGVFMEYQTAVNLIQHNLAPQSWNNWVPRLPELEKMCRSYSNEQGIACWEEIAHVALAKFGPNTKAFFDFCGTSQLVAGAQHCRRHGIGIIAAAENYDLQRIKDICILPQKNDPGFQQDCYIYLVGATLANVPELAPRVVTMCSTVAENYKAECFGEVGSMLASNSAVTTAELAQVCEPVPEAYKQKCLVGHGAQVTNVKQGD